MTDLNVDDFFKDAARVLVALYGVFPRRHAIFVDDIYAAEEPDEFGLHSERYQACFGTLLWLGDENYLRYAETIKNEAIDQAILSGRCFTLLSSPTGLLSSSAGPLSSPAGEEKPLNPDKDQDRPLPDLVRLEHSTHIHRIKMALKNRSSIELRTAMMDLMTHMERRE